MKVAVRAENDVEDILSGRNIRKARGHHASKQGINPRNISDIVITDTNGKRPSIRRLYRFGTHMRSVKMQSSLDIAPFVMQDATRYPNPSAMEQPWQFDAEQVHSTPSPLAARSNGLEFTWLYEACKALISSMLCGVFRAGTTTIGWWAPSTYEGLPYVGLSSQSFPLLRGPPVGTTHSKWET